MKFFTTSGLFQGSTVILGLMGLTAVTGLSLQEIAVANPATHFDFGDVTAQDSYVVVDAKTNFSTKTGFGWLDTADLANRDRLKPDDLRRDFVMGRTGKTFRVTGLTDGRYVLSVVCGDMEYGDHSTRIKIAGATGDLPLLEPTTAEFVTLTTTINISGDLDINFDSPVNNWVVNALTLEPTTTEKVATITRQIIPREPLKSTWEPEVFKTDPTKPLLEQFRQAAKGAPPRAFRPTGLKRDDYLSLVRSEVDFWKGKQDANGAIIDPYKNEEWQYSTPAFAHAAAALVAFDNRKDLIEPAAKAMDWSTRRLSERKAATSHEDFYPPMLAHALLLIKSHVSPERSQRWETDLRRYDPYNTYRQRMGSMNWNIVSSSGEALFQKMGLRNPENGYVRDSLASQGHHFTSPYGLYLEGPMAYDHFPRMWLNDILANGYDGPYRAEIEEAMRRAAITSLFMQSSSGELPAGGRSAHHQWNGAIQCVTYEIYGAKALRDGDTELASVYKRAANLALASMRRWIRPSGELQIVKNWVDPKLRHAYEGYSAHSQYNLWPTSMLALAYEYAAVTENVAERPAPADIGGFLLQIPELHKVFANAGGTYIQLDTKGDPHYDATGLIRVHTRGVSPQLGPSDSLLAHPAYQSPQTSSITSGIGASWKDSKGAWRTVGELEEVNIKKCTVTPITSSTSRVAFDVTYEGDLNGVSRIIEHYVVTPNGVELTTEIPNYDGPLRYVWPVLVDDGRTKSSVSINKGVLSVSQDGGKTAQTFTPRGAADIRIETERYSNHNGWVQLAIADYPRSDKIALFIASKTSPENR